VSAPFFMCRSLSPQRLRSEEEAPESGDAETTGDSTTDDPARGASPGARPACVTLAKVGLPNHERVVARRWRDHALSSAQWVVMGL
jgi:hypothetical protein